MTLKYLCPGDIIFQEVKRSPQVQGCRTYANLGTCSTDAEALEACGSGARVCGAEAPNEFRCRSEGLYGS